MGNYVPARAHRGPRPTPRVPPRHGRRPYSLRSLPRGQPTSTTSPTTMRPEPPIETRGVIRRERGNPRQPAYLVSVHPVFNLYNHEWPYPYRLDPIYRRRESSSSSRTEPGQPLHRKRRRGHRVGGTARRSVLSPGVWGGEAPLVAVEDSVLFTDVVVGPGAVVRRCILDKKGCGSLDGLARIGADPGWDRKHFTVSDRGVVVIGRVAGSGPATPARPRRGLPSSPERFRRRLYGGAGVHAPSIPPRRWPPGPISTSRSTASVNPGLVRRADRTVVSLPPSGSGAALNAMATDLAHGCHGRRGRPGSTATPGMPTSADIWPRLLDGSSSAPHPQPGAAAALKGGAAWWWLRPIQLLRTHRD